VEAGVRVSGDVGEREREQEKGGTGGGRGRN